jgi:uncharacterized membrane protein
MDDAAERYLDELRRNLGQRPEDERSDAVREIESHIAEGQADGRPTASVLGGLGDARTLARAYVADYHLRVRRDAKLGSLSRFALSSAFVSGTGLLSLFIVPLLALLTSLAGLLAVATPVLGVLRTFGVPGIVMGDSGVAGADLVELPCGLGARRHLRRPGVGRLQAAAWLPVAGSGRLPQALAVPRRFFSVGRNVR